MDSEEQDKKSDYYQYVIGKSETANVRESDLFKYLKAQGLADYHSYQNFIKAHGETDPHEIAKQADPKSSRYQDIAAAADKGMTITYIILNISTVILAIASLAFPPIAVLPLVTAAFGIAWNYFDVLGGLVVGGEFLHAGDKVSAFGNFFASIQLTAGTTFYVIGLPSLHLLSGALVTVSSAFASFGFAAFMGISCLLEVRAAVKGKQRIAVLAKRYTELDNPENTDTQKSTKQKALLNYIKVEQTAVQGHKAMARMWFACFVGMTAISIIGVLTLTPMVAGIALAVAAVGTVATGAYRYHLQSKQANMEEGSSLKMPPFDDKESVSAVEIEMTVLAGDAPEVDQDLDRSAAEENNTTAHGASPPGQ
jgi:hypothetical protein